MSSKVFVVAPGGLVSGGPELCHQLADTLNTDDAKRGFVLYHPFGPKFATPQPYQRYLTYPARVEDVEPGSTIVLPEVYADLVDAFPDCRVMFWWMSVGNFYRRADNNQNTINTHLDALRQHVDLHLYQSEYARQFLEDTGLGPAHRLSDQLADDYLKAIADPPGWPRQDLVVYNPMKGLARTEQILRALGRDVQAVGIEGMTRSQILHVLGTAKVYIDFGGHPGKDRLPREAAALGACVLTNRRGSAANPIDIPIPEQFKIKDRKPGFERRAANTIRMLLRDFDQQQPRYDPYRRMIAHEPADFRGDAAAVFTEGISK